MASDLLIPPTPLRLQRLKAVLSDTGTSRSQWYDLMARGEAPRPIVLHGRAVAWRSDEIAQWIATRANGARTVPRPRAGGGPTKKNAPAAATTRASSAHVEA